MPLESSKIYRDIQSIHSAPKTLSTALEMAKNQGLDSACQNKKIKIKNFERRQRRDVLADRGDAPYTKRVENTPFTGMRDLSNMSLFVAYVPKLNEAPAGAAAGAAAMPLRGAGLLLRGCCCKRGEMKRSGAGGGCCP